MLFCVRRTAVKAVSRSIQAFKSAEPGGTLQNSYFYLFSLAACMHIMSPQEVLTLRLFALVLMFETGIFTCLIRGRVTK